LVSLNDAVEFGTGGETTHFSVKHLRVSDAFGETPKAAGKDARAPQSCCIIAA
jgi:hypothetical protein